MNLPLNGAVKYGVVLDGVVGGGGGGGGEGGGVICGGSV